jgi:hypothetical protein
MKSKLLFLAVLLLHPAYSQWSTKPYADSGLYVCPGFDPGIVTFDDGSSIVLGLLSSYIYAQKLDSAGYKIWPTPVLVFHNDASDMVIGDNSERTWFCSDGDGGVILYWQDYRGAYYATDGPKNSITHLQRVDKNGIVRWGTDGIQVNNLQDGYKMAQITPDGSGGCALLWSEYGYNYPGSPNINYLKLARYDPNGNRLWSQTLDSTLSGANPIEPYMILKGGSYYYFTFYNGGNLLEMINDNGDLITYKSRPLSAVVPLQDGHVFFMDYTYAPDFYKISKTDNIGDTLWTRIIDVSNFCPGFGGGVLFPDLRGGVHLVHICNDSIIYLDSSGNSSYEGFKGIGNYGNYFFSDGGNGLLAANATTVVRYDNAGLMILPDTVVYLYDVGNAYAKYFIPDHNGGFIVAYWSTIGGIFVQHTGRHGRLGIVTEVEKPPKNIPFSVELYQNYPNPFNSSTEVSYAVAKKSKILLNVYDVLGRRVVTLVDKIQEKGTYVVQVNLPVAASGAYFYRLIADGQIQITHKMVLTK